MDLANKLPTINIWLICLLMAGTVVLAPLILYEKNQRLNGDQTAFGRFDVSIHYRDSERAVYTVLDTVFCKQYLGTSDGGLELLEINKPCLNRKKARNQ